MTKPLPFLAALLFLLSGPAASAQNWCGTKSFEQLTLERTDLSGAEKSQLIHEHEKNMLRHKEHIDRAPQNLKDETVYVIPVVFHIVHNFGPENISEEQIYDQLRIMNEEYRFTQSGRTKIRDEFKELAADSRVEFRLATKDPEGRCTNGILRHVNPNTNFTSISQIQKYKPQIFWPTDRYLNCLIVGTIESSGGGRVLGYAQFPFSFPGYMSDSITDGLVMVHDATGSIGTGGIGRSSVTTHEVGHWLGLHHTWGSRYDAGSADGCGDPNGDYVDDTPKTIGSPSVCDLNEKTCGPLANVQNYMDYSYCDEMFTAGQRDRMHYYLNNSRRKSLWQPENVKATGTDYVLGNRPPIGFCKADFNHSATEPFCVGTTIQFADVSYEGVNNWKWSFPGGEPSISVEKNPVVVYNKPGVYSASLLVSDGNETKVVTKTDIIRIFSKQELGTFYKQNFETLDLGTDMDFSITNIDEDRTFVISDSAGFNSSRSLYINNFNIPNGRVDAVESSTLDLRNTTKPMLSFKYAFAAKDNSTYDQLDVYVSTDCGKNWTKRKIIKASALVTSPVTPEPFAPDSASQWKEALIDLSLYRVEGLRFKFEWLSGGGNNMYIDNINVSDLVGMDPAALMNANYTLQPNPGDEQTTLSFSLSTPSLVSYELMDITGKLVRGEVQQTLPAGDHAFNIDRNGLLPGVYLIRVNENNRSIIKKLVFN